MSENTTKRFDVDGWQERVKRKESSVESGTPEPD